MVWERFLPILIKLKRQTPVRLDRIEYPDQLRHLQEPAMGTLLQELEITLSDAAKAQTQYAEELYRLDVQISHTEQTTTCAGRAETSAHRRMLTQQMAKREHVEVSYTRVDVRTEQLRRYRAILSDELHRRSSQRPLPNGSTGGASPSIRTAIPTG